MQLFGEHCHDGSSVKVLTTDSRQREFRITFHVCYIHARRSPNCFQLSQPNKFCAIEATISKKLGGDADD
jgi:hypothetical protein